MRILQYYAYLCNINCNSYQEMNFKDILHKFRTESFTEKEKGTKFERLMRSWLLTDPRYNELEKVWLWEDFPGRKDFGGTDTGIDLVAKTEMGDYWAIQCKCYAEDRQASRGFIPRHLQPHVHQRSHFPDHPVCQTDMDFNHQPLGKQRRGSHPPPRPAFFTGWAY